MINDVHIHRLVILTFYCVQNSSESLLKTATFNVILVIMPFLKVHNCNVDYLNSTIMIFCYYHRY